MKQHASTTAIVLIVGLAVAIPAYALSVGEVEVAFHLDPGEHPEGIAFDGDGNLYFGNRTDTPAGYASTLVRIKPGKDPETIASFAVSPLGTPSLLGLTTDQDGDVYAALVGGPDHGVWRVSSNGKHKTRIPGSENIAFPNALTFDAQGNLYVTDSGPVVHPVGGGIWRLARGASAFELWTDHVSLSPIDEGASSTSLFPGANGIAFRAPDTLYVANSERNLLLRVGIEADGSAATPEVIAGVPFPDGIAVDIEGQVHVALPGHAILPLVTGLPIRFPPLIVVNPDTGVWTGTTDAAYDDLFDVPLSIAFDTRPGRRTHLYATNGDLAIAPFPIGTGPRLTRADVGVRGYPLR